MNTNIRNLAIVGVSVVVLGGVAAALLMTRPKAEETSSESSASTIELVSKSSADVTSMKVINQKGGYTILPVATKKSASSSTASGTAEAERTYWVKELGSIPANTTAVSQVVQNGYSLVATKNLGNVKNLKEFGLENPKATVEITFKDGSTYNYKIGNVSATDSTLYYMCGENSSNVYTVSIDSGILEGKDYFITKEVLAISSSTGVNDFAKIQLSGANFPQPIRLQKSGSGMVLTSPVSANTDSEKLGAIETALTSMTADSVEAVNPDAAALKSCGLDKPAIVAEYTVNKQSFKFLIGAKKDAGYSVMLDKVPVVYLVKEDGVSALVQATVFGLRSKSLLTPEITAVKSLTVSANGTGNVFTVTRMKDEAKSTEDKTQYIYSVTGTGGKKLDYSKNYTDYFKIITSLQILEPAGAVPSGTPEVKVEFTYFDRKGTDTVAFYKSGERRYTAVVNGTAYGLVTDGDLQRILDSTKALQNGEAFS